MDKITDLKKFKKVNRVYTVDLMTIEQLRELSQATGLSMSELVRVAVNSLYINETQKKGE